MLTATPGQTVGPFFHDALPYSEGADLVPRGHPDAIHLHGRVLDGAGNAVPDALIELWQADAEGNVVTEPGSLHRDGWTFTGWGRAATDREGRYSFTTVSPGATDPGRPPFFAMTVFARGLLNRLFTRAYLPGAGTDPLLDSLEPSRRSTLLAVADAHGFCFDIRLQGEDETVFLSFPTHRTSD